MTASEELVHAIEHAMDKVPLEDRFLFVRNIFVPVLERIGYDFAHHVRGDSAAAIFVMTHSVDGYLRRVSDSLRREIASQVG